MQQHQFGHLPTVSTLVLGGGLGMLWGRSTFDECVATVHAAVAAGITLLDLAPRYGDGKAQEVVGEAFGGKLPAGLRVTSKCNLGNPPPGEIDMARPFSSSSMIWPSRSAVEEKGKSSRVNPSGGTPARLIRVSA